MISRIGWFASFGLAACLILVGAGWINGQQEERRFGRWYYGPATSSEHFDCDEGIEQAGFRNEPALNGRNQPQAENGQYRAQAENGTPPPGLRSSAVVGASVRLGDGNRVGRIEELMIGESGSVDYMIVSFDSMPGFGGRLAAIPWNAGQMDFAARTVTLDIERERLHEAPIFFSRGRWPDLYEPQWAASVHAHFGTEADGDRTIRRAYPTPKRSDDSQPDENGARPRPPRNGDSKQLRPAPAPERTTQPAPEPAEAPAPKKNDTDKTGESPDDKSNAKDKETSDKPENNNKKPD
jgi:hypothetical protein